MTSLLAKVALTVVLTIASAVGLVGLSGAIIFADLQAPTPASVVNKAAGVATKPLAISGTNP